MKQIRHSAVLLIPAIALCFFAVSIGFAHAQSANTFAQQPDDSATYSTQNSNGDFFDIVLPPNVFHDARIDQAIVTLQGGNAFSAETMDLQCFLDVAETQNCGLGAPTVLSAVPSAAGKAHYIFSFVTGTFTPSGSGPALAASTTLPSVYDHARLRFTKTAGAAITVYGNAASGSGGIPYYFVMGGYLLDWTGINATSTALTALYQGGASSTLGIIQARCTGTGGGIFGEALCATIAFLFVPDPTILDGYTNLAVGTLPSRFPFSWYYGVKSAYTALTASSTANMAAVSINFAAVDPATSTPFGAILPNATVLSSSTISHFLSPSLLALILSLETAAIWVLFALYIFHDVQHAWLKK